MDNIDRTNDRDNIAFLGSRRDVWHRLGQEMKPGMSIADWAKEAGLEWEAIKVPAVASLEGPDFDHIEPAKRFRVVEGRNFIVRGDNGYPLGYASTQYQTVQPREVLEWFDRYISVDDRFALDVAGSLGKGETIWATATFRDPLSVAGDRHVARLLMSTTFDASRPTVNQGSMTRVVCQNTLMAAFGDKRAVVKTSHRTKFNPERVAKELAQIAQGFADYKAMGDAMAANEMSKAEVSRFFKEILDIPFEAKEEEVSTRKLNQFHALNDAYRVTGKEGHTGNAWAALNSITRWIDHDRSTKGRKNGEEEARFTSATFGSGADLKAKAVGLLMPRIADKVKVPA